MDTHDPVRFLQLEVGRLRDENRELKEELGILRSSVRTLSSLQDLIRGLSPGMDVIALLDDLLASALAVVGASDGSLMLLVEGLPTGARRGHCRLGCRQPKAADRHGCPA